MSKQKAGETWTADTIVKKSDPPVNLSGTDLLPIEEVREIAKPKPKEAKMATKSNNGNGGLKVAMTFKKETKGTYVYEADDAEAFITQLYIKKGGMADGKKDKINVTVT